MALQSSFVHELFGHDWKLTPHKVEEDSEMCCGRDVEIVMNQFLDSSVNFGFVDALIAILPSLPAKGSVPRILPPLQKTMIIY